MPSPIHSWQLGNLVMIVSFAILVISLGALMWSADKFVGSAAITAKNLGLSPMFIGLTVVAFGTSAPEMFASGAAALNGAPALGIGNALGSNITNIALVVGLTALIRAMPITSSVAKGEAPLVVGVTVLAGLLMWNNELSFIDGLILLGAMPLVLFLLFKLQGKELVEEGLSELDEAPTGISLVWLSLSLAGLLISAYYLVDSASDIARFFGVSELVIGLTVVAFGTSLPELAATLASALKNQHDIAIGNILGSNLFNLLVVLPLPALIAPGPIGEDVMARDYPLTLALTCALALMILSSVLRRSPIGHVKGGLLLATYLAYMGYLGYQATLVS